ncbi:cation channel family transporter (macronuclear) [Tetrahymena thermophila SB210]|uniref:Cation channel family transporter n=1 Tax=Tetrahymena thermophila (strain SB210) TaxID=312017 RepID=I7MDP9_TETTS|nr:cation channel family transporter [Tetrahymena thermophila SB210]EAR90720.2 cation channel family transporter [Tetrahymena thermophila SB210]|eukprot:XP_001010965.2 cation channel family transporter [Tetrahymena thermophila SB210]
MFDKGVHFRDNVDSQSRSRTQKSILSSYSIKQNYRESINETLNSDVSAIAKLSDFKDLLIEARTINTTEKGLKSMKTYNKLTLLRQFSFVILILLAFFERPIWCTNQYNDYCRVSPEGVRIPTSNIPYIQIQYYYPIEILVVCFLTYNRYLNQSFLKVNKQKYWFYTIITITLVLITEDIVKATYDAYPINISLFLKPLYFISFNRILRRTIKIYAKIIQKVLPIFIIIALNIMFFALLGRIIFYNQQNENYFDNFFDSWFNFTVLQTTSNFPDVMMQYYNEHRWAPIVFVTFLLINLILLLNTVLAVFYSNYKKEMENDTKKFFFKNKEKIHEYINKYIITNPNKALSKQNQQLLQSFLKFHVRNQHFSASEQFKLSQDLEIKTYSKSWILRLFRSFQWNIFTGCLSLFNFTVLYIMVPSLSQKTDLDLWANVNFCINLVYFFEQLIQLIIFSKKYFKVKKYYIFDFFASIVIITLLLIYYFTGEDSVLPYCMYLICTRLIRFIFILFKFESIKTIFRTVYEFVPLFVNLFGVLIIMFFFFSALGQHIFGGKMTYSYQAQIDEELHTEYYVLNNFNDQATSLVLLFELLIVNNWMLNVQAHQIIMGTKNVRYFFILWYIVSVVVCMNIMVAFIIDHLVNKFNDSDNQNDSAYNYVQQQIHEQKQLNKQHSLKFSIFSQQSEDIFQEQRNTLPHNNDFSKQSIQALDEEDEEEEGSYE